MSSESSSHQDRREFFHRSLARILGPVGEFLEKRLDVPGSRTMLRPPGALPEREFLDTCARCGACVDVCPADAIVPLESGDQAISETPVILPDHAACVVCEGLECMKACPTGALRLVDAPEQIRMGLARVSTAACVRSHGKACSICVDRCPMGSRALRFTGAGPPEVLDDGCVGCGVCQEYCPTTPRAIIVEPY